MNRVNEILVWILLVVIIFCGVEFVRSIKQMPEDFKNGAYVELQKINDTNYFNYNKLLERIVELEEKTEVLSNESSRRSAMEDINLL